MSPIDTSPDSANEDRFDNGPLGRALRPSAVLVVTTARHHPEVSWGVPARIGPCPPLLTLSDRTAVTVSHPPIEAPSLTMILSGSSALFPSSLSTPTHRFRSCCCCCCCCVDAVDCTRGSAMSARSFRRRKTSGSWDRNSAKTHHHLDDDDSRDKVRLFLLCTLPWCVSCTSLLIPV